MRLGVVVALGIGCVPWVRVDDATADASPKALDVPTIDRPDNGRADVRTMDVPWDAARSDILAEDSVPATDATAVDARDVGAVDLEPAADVPAVDSAASCGALELSCAGACRAVLHDPMNCGDCGAVCPAVPGATPTCMGGHCGFACDAAHADCDERPSNGCESERATDHENCGACGHACDAAHGCSAGLCALCPGGSPLWCPGTGCTSRGSDARNCGGCGVACPPGAVCQSSSCAYVACTPATAPPDAGARRTWTQCPGGCVDVESDPTNCGRCGNACAGSAVCEAGGCRACPSGMAAIPAGTFTMGATDNVGEQPPHAVSLSAFCMDTTEVTVAAFRACVTASACTAPGAGSQCSGLTSAGDAHPVTCVSWDQARAHCRWRGGDLPTEAQWEYAARGTDGRAYPWGSGAPAGRLCGNGAFSGTCPVGMFPSGNSPFGIADMAGNVWEWVADWYGAYPAASGSPVADPTGPSTGAQHVYRGGAWYLSLTPFDQFRAASRSDFDPSLRLAMGFRCARRQ